MNRFFPLLLFMFPLIGLGQGKAVFQKPEARVWADSVMLDMSLEEKIGQLFMVAAYSNQGEGHKNKMLKQIEEDHIGGLIFFQGGPVRQANLTNLYQSKSKIPLLVGMDAEWGLSMRLDSTFKYPWAMTTGAVQDTQLLYQMGYLMGKECRRLGVHINFAPVLDINTNPDNPIINARSYGQDKSAVTWHAMQMMKGMQDAGVMACGKHFPGHGDTDKDSHKELPSVTFDLNRINNVELYPFEELINKGLASVMVAHLNVPALDITGTPTSVSEKVVTDVLKKQLGFDGLIITDALNMKGVSSKYAPGIVDVKAFKAGNDILLFPADVPLARQKLIEAINKEEISIEELNDRVRKILMSKYWLGLDTIKKIKTKGLFSDLNSRESLILRKKLMDDAVTVLINKEKLIPILDLDEKKYACISMGTEPGSSFAERLSQYAPVDHFTFTGSNGNEILNELSKYDRVFIGLYTSNVNPWKSYKTNSADRLFIKKVALQSSFVLTVFANPYSLRDLEEIELADGLIMAYQNNEEAQNAAAEVIFGGQDSKGKLPVNSTDLFDAGYGIQLEKVNRLSYGYPEEVGIDARKLNKIDSIANWGISTKATPGCQILIAKSGKVFYQKSFGYHTYNNKSKVENSDIYDLASITKITATLPVLMNMYENGKFSLDATLGEILPITKGTNKENLNIRDVLAHQSGLTPWIPFYLETLKDQQPSKKYYDTKKSREFPNQVAENLYVVDYYFDTMLVRINESPLGNQNYKYSDLGYYYFLKFIQDQKHVRLDEYVKDNLYDKLGAYTLGYKPLDRFPKNRITPTENDKYFRYQQVHGYVHDQGASMMGGVAGHAGLFSNANDLAKVMQMYLQKGSYGGIEYFKPSTVEEFTRCQYCENDNRRGAGFDKPQLSGNGPTCGCVSLLSFGHTGFTGTIAWVDPEEEIVYIFLSNRVYPDAENKKLIYEGIRTEIQEVIYESLNSLE